MTEQPFTTQPHSYIRRGNKTVRQRCIEYCETLTIQGTKELPLEQAKELFSLNIIDLWDERTLNKYFGTQEHRNTKQIECRKQYATGFVSNRTITLTQHIHHKTGLLEKLGLVHYEQRGKTWFMILENRVLVPELVKGSGSNVNLCIVHRQGEYYRNLTKHPFHKEREAVASNLPMARSMLEGSNTNEKRLEERSEREYIGADTNRSSESDLPATPSVTDTPTLTPLETAILNGKYTGPEKDRYRVNWGGG